MKKRLIAIALLMIALFTLSGCESDYGYQDDYGYGSPKPGESFSDYFKREDPELYDSMKENYESMFGDW